MLTYSQFIALVSAHIGSDYAPRMFEGFQETPGRGYSFQLSGYHGIYTYRIHRGAYVWGYIHSYKGGGSGKTLDQALSNFAPF